MVAGTVMERLGAGEVIIGDGSYVFTLEKRGYVQAGNYASTLLHKYARTHLHIYNSMYQKEN